MCDDLAPLIHAGQGYVNLTNDDAYGGAIEMYADWVTVTTPDQSKYTLPRRKVDFINWKPVQGIDE